MSRVLLGLMLAGAAGCASQGDVQAAKAAPVASERATLLADALRWWSSRVLGSHDLSEWVLVVEAGSESQQVVGLMEHPAFTTVMPTDVELGPIYTIDRQSGRKVCRFTLAVTEVAGDSAYVTVSYSSGDRKGGTSRVELAPEPGGWRVVSDVVLSRS